MEKAETKPAWIAAGVLLAFAVWLIWSWATTPEGRAFWSCCSAETVRLSEVLRNFGLVALGAIGLPLAIWRSMVAASNARTAERNAKTAELGHQNERYQTAAKMLGDPVLAVRLGGIYALDRLARDNPEAYHITVIQLFCAFVRNPPRDDTIGKSEQATDDPGNSDNESLNDVGPLRQDIEEVVERIRIRSKTGTMLEIGTYSLNLSMANLRSAGLWKGILGRANLNHAVLIEANLLGADLHEADLRNADLRKARLEDVDFRQADLRGANLKKAEMPGANFCRAKLLGADLSGAYVGNAIFTDAILKRTDLGEVGPLMEALEGVNYPDAIFPEEFEIGEDGIARGEHEFEAEAEAILDQGHD